MCWGGLAERACGCGQERLRGEVLGDGGGAGELTCRRGEAGNRRGRQSHVNLQLSCSFLTRDSERTPARAGWALGYAGRCVGDVGKRSGPVLRSLMELAVRLLAGEW